ncbi:Ig-like domain-containing protein, partial [Flavobacterium sp. W22_SRS_FP1]|uniref:Ig-like domain-containing protein n=1 Tax=Flavobacterium sp. W22_SRS_FP1 TaxID=3240276 RepID=UPI003F91834C
MKYKFIFHIIILLATQICIGQNSISISNSSGVNNTEIEIAVLIDNAQTFTGFQFDITLPTNISYIANSIIIANRAVNHTISTSVINGTTLRILAYSPTNTNFIGTSGEIFKFRLKPNTLIATYPLNVTNGIISNISNGNIINNTVNGSLQVLANNESNIISVGNAVGYNYSEIEIPVLINNTQTLNAFQFDITLPNNIYYVENSIIQSNRFAGHSISVSVINGSTLRFIAFSTSNANFISSSGEIFKFKLRLATVPGNYPLIISNGIISNLLDGNVLTNSTNGNLKVIQSNENNSLILSNVSGYNNTEIEISVIINNSQTSYGFQFDIALPNGIDFVANSIVTSSRLANQNIVVNNISPNIIRFTTSSTNVNIIGNSGEVFKFKLRPNTNPGTFPLEISNCMINNLNLGNVITNQTSAQLVVLPQNNINTITLGTVSGDNNSQITFPVSIDNSQQFNAFQFDITLPNNTSLVNNSIIFLNRNTNHIISSSLINSNTIRFICYSPSNDWFIGNSGAVFTFKLTTNLASGNYPLLLSNLILSNQFSGNIITNSENGALNINSSELIITTNSFQFGNIPIYQPLPFSLSLQNSGNTNIIVSSLNFPNAISCNSIIPFTISPNTTINLPLLLTPILLGNYNQNITINHNGNSKSNIVNIQADVIPSNYLKIIDKTVLRNSSDIISLNLINSNSIRAIQFDLNFPLNFIFDDKNVQASSLISNFTISSNQLANGNYRFVIYSLNSSLIPIGNNLILSLPVFIQNNVSIGDYPLTISNLILSNIDNQNCYSNELSIGNIHVAENIINTAPIAQNDEINTYVSCSATNLIGNITSILSNDSDTEGSTLIPNLISPPNHGTLTLNNNGTFIYIHDGSNILTDSFTYKANDGLLDSNIATVNISISPNIIPTFTQVNPICSGAILSALATTSNNTITGTWSPALNNTATTTYTFTPTLGQCATTAMMTIVVNPQITPTFTQVNPICSGAILSALPTTSNNTITGTWSPALNNTATTAYTFTPTLGQCATTAMMTIVVNPQITPTFTQVNPICSGAILSA